MDRQGRRREERQLKNRAKGETRIVPCPPALTALLHAHLSGHGTAPGGRLFRGVRGGELAESTYCRVWRKARVQALSAAEAASPLAGRPYDLRHAVSTWLNAGVPSTQVAEWAGRSLAVLLQIYAKCLVGQEEMACRRIHAVPGSPDAWNFGTYSVQPPGDCRCRPDTPGPTMIGRRGRQERIAAGQRRV